MGAHVVAWEDMFLRSSTEPDSSLSQCAPANRTRLALHAPAHEQSLVTINFALHTRTRSPVYVMLFPPLDESDANARVTRDILAEFPMTASTGEIRHVCVGGVPVSCAYAFRIEGIFRALHDIHSRFLESRAAGMWGRYEGESYPSGTAQEVEQYLHSFDTLRNRCSFPICLSRFTAPQTSLQFDWGDDKPPEISVQDLLIYEAHVRGLTAALSRDEGNPFIVPGTFAAAIERIKYLKRLGVTALQLLPISEFSELETSHTDELKGLTSIKCHGSSTGSRPLNFWGYSPVQPAAFTPMNRYGATPTSAPAELKTLVKALHVEGMECYLDLVFNHVAGPSCSLHFHEVHDVYFMHPPGQRDQHLNVSGCGNTLAPNRPAIQALILDSLRWWVSEYHIDGFRLDAGGVFARDGDGRVVKEPSVLRAIAEDPLLQNVKIIVEPWDAGNAIGSPNYLNGSYPFGNRFLEWNPDYMRAVRKFIRGDSGSSRSFCKVIRGSSHMFRNRKFGSGHSVNFVSCHDGFCLADVVCYTTRTNIDGYPDDTTFNYGVEGETADEGIVAVRSRQMRNMVLALAVSRGTPMLAQGDELCVSKAGNNNSYDIDGPLNYLPAKASNPEDRKQRDMLHFTQNAFEMRRTYGILRGVDFYDSPKIQFRWLTAEGEIWKSPKVSKARKNTVDQTLPMKSTRNEFVAFIVHEDNRLAIYVAFNASACERSVLLPVCPEGEHGSWRLYCDTAAENGNFFPKQASNNFEQSGDVKHCMPPFSAVVYIASNF